MTALSPQPAIEKKDVEQPACGQASSEGQRFEVIGRLTGDIAHEFNNLLHVVNMNLELISQLAQQEKVKPAVERARSAARHGARLTGQLLSFATRQSQPPTATDVNDLLMGMKDLLEISAGPGISVELELREQDSSMVLDPGQLEMALLNLALSWRHALADGGQLKISTRRDERMPEGERSGEGGWAIVTVGRAGMDKAASVKLRFPAQAACSSRHG